MCKNRLLAAFGDGRPDGAPPTFRRFTKYLILGHFNIHLLGRGFLLAT
jgi:hypothetical protein